MSADQWRVVWRLFDLASELPVAERRRFLMSESSDSAIVQEVLALLADADAGSVTQSADRSNTQVSHYRVGHLIGRGGMGEVYEAVDLELDRRVAIKFLPKEILSDERAVRRFLAEARSASALNHPNLVTVHEFVRDGHVMAIVMELIEGKALRPLIGEPVPDDVLLGRVRQLAEALAAAHGRGIIHRDLKPENIMIRGDGYVKVLDFGLAGLVDAATHWTGNSWFAGTPRYMSPEQRRGVPLSPATDVYSLGLVILEMFFGSADPAVLKAGGRRLPAGLARVLPKMFAEDPGARPSAPEIVAALSIAASSRARRPVRYAVLVLAAVVAAVGFAVAAWKFPRSAGEPAARNLVGRPLTALPGEEFEAGFSPDGEHMVFVWDGEKQDNFDLYTMDLRSRAVSRLTSNPARDLHPAWSPDGKTIAFYRETSGGRGWICLLSASGGEPRILREAVFHPSLRRALDWSPDGRWLVFYASPSPGQDEYGLYLISAETGEIRQLTRPPAHVRQTSPAFSPDGRRIVLVRDFEGVGDLAILTLGPDLAPLGDPQPISIAGSGKEVCADPRWSPDGASIVFTSNRGGPTRLWQIPVPASPSRPVEATMIPVGEGVEYPVFAPKAGRLVFTRHTDDHNLWRIDIPPPGGRAGAPVQLLSSTRLERYADISSDGRIAFESDRSGFPEIWVSDADGSDARQVTRFEGPGTGSPRWSPDGRSIAFDTRRDGQPEVYVVGVPGQGDPSPPRRLTSDRAQDNMPAWSPDGRWIYFNSNRSGPTQVWRMPAAGGDPQAVSPANARGPVLSPDGKWIYYSRGSRVAGEVWRIPSEGGPESLVAGNVVDRGFVPGRAGVWLLRRREGLAAALYYLDLRAMAEKLVAELSGRIQPGLAVSSDEKFAVFTRADEGTRDLILVEGFGSR